MSHGVAASVKLLGINENQQFGRFPIHFQMPPDIVSVPSVEHFEQDLIDLLRI
jgi:hypothetical protein